MGQAEMYTVIIDGLVIPDFQRVHMAPLELGDLPFFRR